MTNLVINELPPKITAVWEEFSKEETTDSRAVYAVIARAWRKLEIMRRARVRYYATFLRELADYNTQRLEDAQHWSFLPWDDGAWNEYIPPESMDSAPTDLRIGELRAKDESDKELSTLRSEILFLLRRQYSLKSEDNLFAKIDFRLPILFPFLTQKSTVFFSGKKETRANEISLLQSALFRFVLSCPPGRVKMILCDPIGMGQNITAFTRLPKELYFDKALYRRQDIDDKLAYLEEFISDTFQKKLQDGTSIEEYNRRNASLAIPYHVLVLIDYPSEMGDSELARLTNITRNGMKAGVYVLGTVNQDELHKRQNAKYRSEKFYPENILDDAHTITARPDYLENDGKSFSSFVPDKLPNLEMINSLVSVFSNKLLESSLSLSFDAIAIPPEKRFTGNSATGIEVPIGFNEQGDIQYFSLGQSGAHHALVGGITGSGKSNFLHILITQMALLYSESELQMYLIDFKEGVEFKLYQNLPHAQILALQSDRNFGLQVLRNMQQQITSRSNLFKEKEIDASNIAEYREKSGKQLPRIILLMDEFQQLVEGNDDIAGEATELLKDLVKRGRSFGLHILLSSQKISSAQLKDIYEQIGIRIAFKVASRDASETILGERNTGAVELEKAGEAIYNDKLGRPEGNVRLRVAFLDNEKRQRLIGIFPQGSAKFVFNGHEPAQWENNQELIQLLQGRKKLNRVLQPARAWVGESLEIKPPVFISIERESRANVLLAGGKGEQAGGVLLSMLVSLIAQYPADKAKFHVAEFRPPQDKASKAFRALDIPNLTFVNSRQAVTLLSELAQEVEDRLQNDIPEDDPEIFVFLPNFPKWRDIKPERTYENSEAGQAFLKVAREGPEVGIHLLISLDTLENAAGAFATSSQPNWTNSFSFRILFHTNADDVYELTRVRKTSIGSAFALLRDEAEESGEVHQFRPYVVPHEEWLQSLGLVLGNSDSVAQDGKE